MTVDPLSQATRAAKRNLLIVSMLAITFRAFDVTIEQIPVAGLSIQFDKGVFSFLILIALLYFFVTFVLYYFIDIRNVEITEHQNRSQSIFNLKSSEYENHYLLSIADEIESALPGSVCKVADSFRDYLRRSLHGDTHFSSQHAGAYLDIQKNGPPKARPTQEEFNKAIDIALRRARVFPSHLRKYQRRLYPRFYAVTFTYFVRNYFVDGIFPVGVSIVALLAMFGFVDVKWLRHLVPIIDRQPI